MGDFQKVSSALNQMQVDSKRSSPGSRQPAAKEDVDQHGYAVPRDNIKNLGGTKPQAPPALPQRGVPVMVPDSMTGNEYAQPIIDNTFSGGVKPLSRLKQQRERREQMAAQQGKGYGLNSCSWKENFVDPFRCPASESSFFCLNQSQSPKARVQVMKVM